MYLDADAHVDECTETWSYFPKRLGELRPTEMVFREEQPTYLRDKPAIAWFIDGEVYSHLIQSDEITGTTLATRQLADVPGRLADMDQLGVATQILYPTLLLYEVTSRAELEVAVCESYNRWIADRCADSAGRLRWVAVLPTRSIPDALVELRRVKEAGAVGILKRGVESDERRANSPYFDPLYALAEELDLPVCFHTSRPYRGVSNYLTNTKGGIYSPFFIQDAFLALLNGKTPARFPDLRFGFVEAAAGWVPYALWSCGFDHFSAKTAGAVDEHYLRDRLAQTLQDAHFTITCEVSENLPVIVDQLGDDSLCIGTDYGHVDRAAVAAAHRSIFDRTDLSKETAEKLTQLNAQRLYGLA